ncbi:MurG-like transferase [Phycisphaerae bacterium RAS1]|nr:MurG-like transferase [Phycisphaerae bacterium RAS1]
MRIAYGIFGYGRGHATRAAAVLPELRKRHELLILAGGDAYDTLWPTFPIHRIPTLGYVYRPGGKRSNWLTFRRNLWDALDILLRGPTFRGVVEVIADFRPDVVIADAEPWTHRAAQHLGIPRISFDHFGILAYCKPPVPFGDRLRSRRDVMIYRMLMGRPQRVIVSSFYDAPARRPGVVTIGPMLRDEVLRAQPRRGEYLLAYFNKGQHQFTAQVEAALRMAGLPVLVYGTPRQGLDGRLDFRPLSNEPFVEDLSGCRAVISTAGNQLVGEAVHLGKPMLVMPEDCVEQRLNAAALERLGIGMRTTQAAFSAATIAEFLRREVEFIARVRGLRRDGRAEALEAIERFLVDLAPASASRHAVELAAGRS